MAMQVGEGSSDDVMIDINTTPLIDVMLVLIIMLIITIPIQTHADRAERDATQAAGDRAHRHRLRRHDRLERHGGRER
jgi:biopolymer transport protein ExbD